MSDKHVFLLYKCFKDGYLSRQEFDVLMKDVRKDQADRIFNFSTSERIGGDGKRISASEFRKMLNVTKRWIEKWMPLFNLHTTILHLAWKVNRKLIWIFLRTMTFDYDSSLDLINLKQSSDYMWPYFNFNRSYT